MSQPCFFVFAKDNISKTHINEGLIQTFFPGFIAKAGFT